LVLTFNADYVIKSFAAGDANVAKVSLGKIKQTLLTKNKKFMDLIKPF
jgi:hypothetical protein